MIKPARPVDDDEDDEAWQAKPARPAKRPRKERAAPRRDKQVAAAPEEGRLEGFVIVAK